MDYSKIDDHKLALHPSRVAEYLIAKDSWVDAKSIYPIYMEISPVGACNHRCTFCSVDYIGYQTRMLPEDVLVKRVKEMGANGVKSLMFAGEGEPTLYKPLPRVLEHCTEIGIDTAITTNMVPFTERNTESFVQHCTWIKASINGGDDESYSKIHRTKKGEFQRVLSNMEMAVNVRNSLGFGSTIGAQIVLLPENSGTVIALAEALRERGVDYLVVKPYTQSLYGNSRIYAETSYEEYEVLDQKLQELSSNEFEVIFRRQAMSRLNEAQRAYPVCQATPFFWAYVMANGDLYACSAYLQDERFKIGNILDTPFNELWESDGRKRIYDFVRNDLDISQCRLNCRMESVNRYLWELQNPEAHVNFI